MAKREVWPFKESRNSATVTVRRVLNRKDPITLVSHDADGWQFLNTGDGEAPDFSDAAVVALEEIVRLDPSVIGFADMPVGWKAFRKSARDPWIAVEPEPSQAARKKRAAKRAGKKKAASKEVATKKGGKKKVGRKGR